MKMSRWPVSPPGMTSSLPGREEQNKARCPFELFFIRPVFKMECLKIFIPISHRPEDSQPCLNYLISQPAKEFDVPDVVSKKELSDPRQKSKAADLLRAATMRAVDKEVVLARGVHITITQNAN